MGIVYRATELALDRPVAIKFIAADLASDPAFRKRFTAESRTAASLDHPNVIPIYHAGEHEGVLFLVMRYVDGHDLRTQISERGPLEPHRAATIAAQVASALDAAHARGLVHRDVKPANVLLSAGDHPYLTDFGLTKRALPDADETKTGQLVGTLNYVAPEQVRGEKVDSRTDVYALGCVLFHALAGRVPFPMEGQEAKLWAHVSEPPPSVSALADGVSSAFDDVIACAMAKQPADRYQSAGEFGRAAVAAAAGETTRAGVSVGGSVAASEGARSPADARREYNRALVRNALLHRFNLVILAGMLIAGLLLGVVAVVAPVALLVYAGAAVRTYLDEDAQREVLERERSGRRDRLENVRGRLDPASLSPRIGNLLAQALDREARIRAAIDRAELPYIEVSEEVDRFLATMRHTAARAELLHEGIQDAPPEEIVRRLDGVKAERDPGKADLIEALSQQLDVQRKMEGQLRRFYDQMEQMLVELDIVRGHLITVSASTEADNQERLAADVRGLRVEMGAVADGIAAAYEEQTDAHPFLETGRGR